MGKTFSKWALSSPKIVPPLLLSAALILPGFSSEIQIKHYNIYTPKLPRDISISFALITDFHSAEGSFDYSDVLEKLSSQNPSFILLGGDIFSDKLPLHTALPFLKGLAALAPTFFVTGNHEEGSANKRNQINLLENLKITSLNHTWMRQRFCGQEIILSGLMDPRAFFPDPDTSLWKYSARKALELLPRDAFSILLSHRPEQVTLYTELHADLVLSGHAHGGQWRIPYLINGFFSPNQGVFPRYTKGVYALSANQNMIVSSGLGNHTYIPRIYNPPEFVSIRLNGLSS